MFRFLRNGHRWLLSSKGLGLLLLFVGVVVLIRVLPMEFWLVALAAAMCWAGWQLFSGA